MPKLTDKEMAEIIQKFLEERCTSLCMDNAQDRKVLALALSQYLNKLHP